MNIFKKIFKNKKGFTLVEVAVIIAVLVVIVGVLAPSLLRYTENSRMQRDLSAMDEVVRAFQLALVESDILDESLEYEIGNNFVTYTDSSGVYGSQLTDEEFWAPDGSARGTTITFNPANNGTFVLADGFVNEMTFGNGSVVTPTRMMQQRGGADPIQCKFSEMTSKGKTLLFSKVKQSIGENVKLNSSTYRNSSYTVFIKYVIVDGVVRADVSGMFNGTHLSPDCPASVGSGTTGYDENENPNGNKQGQTESSYDSTSLQGGGSVTYKDYPVLENEYIDPQKFWAFCQTVTDDITEIKVVAAYQEGATDISVSGNGRIVAFADGNGVYISAAAPEGADNKYEYSYKVMAAENASNLFDAQKTGFTNIQKISAHMLEVGHCTSMDSMFQDNHNVTVIDIEKWDTGSCKNFSGMFAGCNELRNIKIVKWETAKAIDTSYMFADCYNLKQIATHQITTDKVENMSHMFYNCAALDTLRVSHFQTVNCRDMSSMFEGCVKVLELDVSNFDTALVMNFSSMFKDCVKVSVIDTSKWETGLSQNMSKMFMNCKALTDLNLESWDTANVKSMEQMFYACQYIEELDLSTINSLNSDAMYDMFTGMNRLRMVTVGTRFSFRGSGRSVCSLPAPSYLYIEDADGLWRDENGAVYDPSNIPNRLAATYHAVGNTLPAVLAPRDTWWKGETPKGNIERIKIVNKYRSSSYDESWVADADENGSIVVYIEGRTAYLVNMKNSRVRNAFQLSKDATGTFADFTNLKEIQGLRLINMINTSIADNFFDNCTSLTTIDGYEKWNVQNLVSTNHMFADTKIKFLQLGAWDMASITNLSNMFENTQLTEMDLSNWNVSDVVSFESMFKNSGKLTSVIMRAWETNPTANYRSMFEGCTQLRTISTSSTFVVGASNISMFQGCGHIVGGAGTTYINDSSLYARVDLPDAPGYFTTDDTVGTFSARLYDTGSVASGYTELTTEGASAHAWDYRKGARLLEINLYAMPKRQEKTVTVFVPEGMKIVNNSWTQPNSYITNVAFVPLDRDSAQAGIQQNSGSYTNGEAGTLYITLDAYATQTTIQMLVNVDTNLWSKRATSNNVAKESPIVVTLGNGTLVKSINNVSMSAGLAGNKEGFGTGVYLKSDLIYEGEEQSPFNYWQLTKHEETANAYWTDLEVKITTQSSLSNQSAKIVSTATNPWSNKVVEDLSTDYVFHKKYKDIYTSSLSMPTLKYLCETGKGWQKDEKLAIKYEVTVTYYNGETKTYTHTSNVTVKPLQTEVDLTQLSMSVGSQTIPTIDYYAGAADDVVDHVGYTSLTYSGYLDVPNVGFKYEFDITSTGAPIVQVSATRVVLPGGQQTTAKVMVIDASGNQKGPYTITIKGSSNSAGAYVKAMNVIPASDQDGKQWYLKSIEYTVPKIVGSKTTKTLYHASQSNKSRDSAGMIAGRALGAGSHRVSMSYNGTVFSTKTVNTSVNATPTYSAYVASIGTPLGSTITAGNDFQLDVKVSACSYPYARTSNLVDPVIWVVLPEDVSIIGAQVTDSSGTVLDENPQVTRLKSFTKDDGTIAYVYKVNMQSPQLMSTFIAGSTGITNRNATLIFKVLCETDAAMRSVTMMLRDMVWFSDSHGATALSGSYGGYGASDKYDVNGNGKTSEQLSVTNNSSSTLVIQGIMD